MIDEYGVNLADGTLDIRSLQNQAPPVTIGGEEGLSYEVKESGWRHNYVINIVTGLVNGAQVFRVQIGATRRDFQLVGGSYQALDGLPGTLNSNASMYTDGVGVQYHFTSGSGLWQGEFIARLGSKIVFPSGREEALHYVVKRYTYGSYGGGSYYDVPQLRSVTSNNGYQLKFLYVQSSPGIGSSIAPVEVIGINNAVEYCSPASESCSLTNNWPKLSAHPERRAVIGSTSTSITIKRPGETSPGVVAQIDPARRVTSVTFHNAYTRNYTWSLNGTTMTSTAMDSLGNVTTAQVNAQQNVLLSRTDPNGATITYTYDGSGRIQEIVAPEGQKVVYAYDVRGNVTATTHVAKPGSGLSNRVTSAVYPASCTNLATCNRPTRIIDPKGNFTDFSYDQTHGGLIAIQGPADDSGQRPTTNVSYAPVTARALNASGSLVDQATPIMKVAAEAACRSATTCPGSADERVIAYTYNTAAMPNGATTGVTRRSGDNSVLSSTSISYTPYGQIQSLDGPLSGSDDTTWFRYDDVGRVIGRVSADPDGGGSLPRQAMRHTFDNFDNVTSTETGTVNGTDQPSFNVMAVSKKTVSKFDAFGKLESAAQVDPAGSTQYALTQYGYDGALRLRCASIRMNAPLTSSVLPADACTPMSEGSHGPDRITRNVYDAAGQLVQVRVGVGSTVEAAAITYSYTANGKKQYVVDAEGNRAQFAYDGHDRLQRWYFPSTTRPAAYNDSTPANALASAGSINSGDFEEYGYDANGNRTSLRKRDGSTLTYQYDALNRNTLKVVPERAGLAATHTRDVYYGYDLRGLQTYARFDGPTGEGITIGYGVLGEKLSETLVMDGVSRTIWSGYNANGVRTTLQHPDGNVINYYRDGLGRLYYAGFNGSGYLFYPNYSADGNVAALYRLITSTVSWGWSDAANGFGYDPIGRLSNLATGLVGTSYDSTTTFTRNPASQIASTTRDNDVYAWTGSINVDRNYTANGLNQYTAAGSASFGYDANGNLTSDGGDTYLYDIENRLVSRSGGAATVRYDPLGRLYEVAGPWGTTRFLHDGDALVAEYDTAGNILRRYVHGTAEGVDDPLVWFEGAGVSDSARRYLFADERGSIVAVTDANGNALAINRYDEYGILGAGNQGRFQYTGQAWIPELGLFYYKARMYSPTLGRFMQTDPIGYDDQINLYAYVGNDPVNGTDPTGLICDGLGGDCGIVSRGSRQTGPFLPIGNHENALTTDGLLGAPVGTFLGAADRNAALGPAKLGSAPANGKGRTKRSNSSIADYCGSQGIDAPDGNWGDACRKHDICYATKGRSKEGCDLQLARDLFFSCKGAGPYSNSQACAAIAFIYAGGLILGGWLPGWHPPLDAYNEAQRQR